MSKEQLLALVEKGEIYLDVVDTITRYCVTRRNVWDGSAIYIGIDDDGCVYRDSVAPYYTNDGADESDLTADEAAVVAEAVHRRLTGR